MTVRLYKYDHESICEQRCLLKQLLGVTVQRFKQFAATKIQIHIDLIISKAYYEQSN